MDTVSHSSSQATLRSDGFTLLELLVTLAVAAILVTIAIPSYHGLVQSNSMTATINDLVGDLNYARSEAVTRGMPVYLCKSMDQTTCTKDGDWSQGWLVYAPDPGAADSTPTNDNLLRVHGLLSHQVKISGDDNNTGNRVFFDANGFAMGSIGSFKASITDNASTTCIIISSTGRVRTETPGTCQT